MYEKTDFRDLLCNSLHCFHFILVKNTIPEMIKEWLDSSLIDNLYDIIEKYVEDAEIERVIKNIIRILSLRSEDVSKKISIYNIIHSKTRRLG